MLIYYKKINRMKYIHIYIYIYIYVCVCICVYIYMCVCVCIYMCVCVCVCIYIYIYIYIYVYVYVCVCIYICVCVCVSCLRLSPPGCKRSKSDCPPCLTKHAFLLQSCSGFTLSFLTVCWQVSISPGWGVKEPQVPPCRGLLHQGRFVFFLAPVCIQTASTPKVRVNTSADSIYFHCLHSVQQINLFIQTLTEKMAD